MGLFSFFEGQEATENVDTTRSKELREYINKIQAELRLDWTRRVYGDGVYSGYNALREFYKGKQWSYRKEGGGTMRTYNYIFTIVENMTAFLTNEAPQMTSPPSILDDKFERALAEGRTKLLSAVHEDNDLGLVFQRGARTGSICGDTFIFGAIPVFKVDDEGNKSFDRIRYWNVERPETIRVIWSDDNFNEIQGFIKHYRVPVTQAKKLFKKEIESANVIIQADRDVENTNIVEPSNIPMVTIKEYWDDKEYQLMINADSKIIQYIKHDWGYVPLHFIPNIHLPGEPKGTADIEHELDPQQEYNERASDLADIIKEITKPTYWGKNLDNLSEVRSGQIVIYQVGEDGDIQAMPKSGQTVAMERYLDDRKNDIIALSGLNQVLYPGSQVLQATGRALSVIMQGVNNKISLRKGWWEKAFKNLNEQILFQAESYIPNSKMIINGFYKTDVFISSVLLRSVSDEINKFQAKIQSLTTTQSNVGISNPSEEQKLMKQELEDPILATEIAKQPGLLEQIIAQQRQQQQQGGGQGAPPGGKINGAPPPIANESQNQPGMNPSAMRGQASPVSPQGAAQQVASRNGAAPPVKQ